MAKRDSGTEEALRRIARVARGRDKVLDLAGLRLRRVPEEARAVTWIQWLDLSGTQLTTFPAWLGDYSDLRILSLGGMDLTQIPPLIRQLRKLEHLDVSGNDLATLPDWLGALRRLRRLYVHNNPRLDIPQEVAETGNRRLILNYYRRLGGAAFPLNEFKLILVGRGGVGKTSLVHHLVTNNYKEFKRTPGIQITDWPVKIDKDDVRAHIWDFGGQEIMHGTHRFFMTERALYLVLISGREGTEDHDAEYWLSLVRSFAGQVPIIVLLHKSDDYPVELNRELLRDKYGRDLVSSKPTARAAAGSTHGARRFAGRRVRFRGSRQRGRRSGGGSKKSFRRARKTGSPSTTSARSAGSETWSRRRIRRRLPTACTPLA